MGIGTGAPYSYSNLFILHLYNLSVLWLGVFCKKILKLE